MSDFARLKEKLAKIEVLAAQAWEVVEVQKIELSEWQDMAMKLTRKAILMKNEIARKELDGVEDEGRPDEPEPR